MAADGMTTLRSNHGPKDTMDRLEAAVKARGIAVGAGRSRERERLQPAHEEVAAGFAVVGERKGRAAAALEGADPRQLIECGEQARAVQSRHHPKISNSSMLPRP